MRTPVTEEMKVNLPLYYYFPKYGWCVIHWWAAAFLGCDISPEESGLVGIGRVTYIQALCEFDEEGAQELRAKPFAEKLRRLARCECRASYSTKHIANELERVARWFTSGGTFYGDDGNLRSVSGKLLAKASQATRRHM